MSPPPAGIAGDLADVFTRVKYAARERVVTQAHLRDAHMAQWHASQPGGGSGHWSDTAEGRNESRRFMHSTSIPHNGPGGVYFTRREAVGHGVYHFDPDAGRITKHSHHPTAGTALSAARRSSSGRAASLDSED